MRLLFDEYASAIFEAFVSVFIYIFVVYGFMYGVLNTNIDYIKEVNSPVGIYVDNTPIGIKEFSVKDILIDISDNLNYMEYVSATNTRGEDISSYITILNLPDLNKEGEHELTYVLRYNGYSRAIKAKLIIVDKQKEINDNEEYV